MYVFLNKTKSKWFDIFNSRINFLEDPESDMFFRRSPNILLNISVFLLLTVLALGLLAQETAFAAKHKKQSKKHSTSVSSSKKKKKSKN